MNSILRILLKTYMVSKIPFFNKIWWELFSLSKNRFKNKPVTISIHGFATTQPFNYTYPVTSRLFKTMNNPLIECVYQIAQLKERMGGGGGVILFDIGAAIGDTVLLIKANCPNMVKQFYCVEGDTEFFAYLEKNTACFDNVTRIKTLLSDKHGEINSLVRIHSGTASAQGKDQVESRCFDELVQSLGLEEIDLIKIDTDGYDGKILKGAENTLYTFHPLVIFEWHPILCNQAGTSYHEHFRVLQKWGYKTFIWFTKFGGFSHFVYDPTETYIEQFAEICIKAEFDNDWHYDIIALHEQSALSVLNFANATYSRNKKSPF